MSVAEVGAGQVHQELEPTPRQEKGEKGEDYLGAGGPQKLQGSWWA